MLEFGAVQRLLAEHLGVRWLGPHKGVTHLALASITNACFDLWAKSRGVPIWKLLLDLSPAEITRLIDFSYLEEVLTVAEAVELLQSHQATRSEREGVLKTGYPGYDTSVGWFQYSDEKIRDNAKAAVDAGFTAMKLKVGAKDHAHDVRRSFMVREAVGDDVRIMLDANQAWPLPQAIDACLALKGMNPFWMEEPTQPDGSRRTRPWPTKSPRCRWLSARRFPTVFVEEFSAGWAVGIVQADCTRLAGISEWLAVVMLARKFPVRLVPT